MLVLIKSNQQKDPEPNFDDGFPVLGQSEILNTPTPIGSRNFWFREKVVLSKFMLVKLCCEYLAYADSLSHTLLLVKFF